MKGLFKVLEDRRLQEVSKSLDTVHRSSLIIPIIKGSQTSCSFLNHFYIKRGYKRVTLKLTPYTTKGEPIASNSYVIDKPRVYKFDLDSVIDNERISCFQVEFFCTENLYIPFPAVIINHESETSHNIVHSYNRILNDFTEYKKIIATNTKESGFEYINSGQYSTFIQFQTGINILNASEDIGIEIYEKSSKDAVWNGKLKATEFQSAMTSNTFILNEIFNDLPKSDEVGKYMIKIQQPQQTMFYGRLLAGIIQKNGLAFSANHSYYDSSNTYEYFSGKVSYRTYPYDNKAKNSIIVYPISSPSRGKLSIYANCESNGRILSHLIYEKKYNTNNGTLKIVLNDFVNSKAHDNVETVSVVYSATDENGAPTRFNHQLCYGDKKGTINSSINVSLINEGVPQYKKQKYQSWLQVINKKNYITYTAVCLNDCPIFSESESIKLDIRYFSLQGLFKQESIQLAPLEKYEIDVSSECDEENLWVEVSSEQRGGFTIYTYHKNIESSCCSGEHSF